MQSFDGRTKRFKGRKIKLLRLLLDLESKGKVAVKTSNVFNIQGSKDVRVSLFKLARYVLPDQIIFRFGDLGKWALYDLTTAADNGINKLIIYIMLCMYVTNSKLISSVDLTTVLYIIKYIHHTNVIKLWWNQMNQSDVNVLFFLFWYLTTGIKRKGLSALVACFFLLNLLALFGW